MPSTNDDDDDEGQRRITATSITVVVTERHARPSPLHTSRGGAVLFLRGGIERRCIGGKVPGVGRSRQEGRAGIGDGVVAIEVVIVVVVVFDLPAADAAVVRGWESRDSQQRGGIRVGQIRMMMMIVMICSRIWRDTSTQQPERQ